MTIPSPFRAVLPPRPTARPLPRSGRGADPHEKRSPSHVAALLALALLAGACDRGGSGSTVAAADAGRSIDELVAVCKPGDPTHTSDVEDRAFRTQVELLDRLRKAGPEVGRAALARFESGGETILAVQQALLDVAAHNCPKESAPTLERLITSYDGAKGEGLATRALDVLAQTSPQRAIELVEPLIRDPAAHHTRPSQEALVEAWSTAAKLAQLTDARVLCDVVVDMRQPADARAAAIRALTNFGSERAQKALREVLVEPSSDGTLRRKAAQTLLGIMPRPQFCELITEVSQHESDELFLNFLADLLDKNCPGK